MGVCVAEVCWALAKDSQPVKKLPVLQLTSCFGVMYLGEGNITDIAVDLLQTMTLENLSHIIIGLSEKCCSLETRRVII